MSDKYDVILADPPWHFQNWSGKPGEMRGEKKHGGAQSHYPTMDIDEICSMKIPAQKNSVLFLWACWPLLPEAMKTIDAWGFKYKTIAWVWVKAKKSGFGFHFGMGYYTRSNTEPCLLATRGKLPSPENRKIQALIYYPVREHSRKPDDQYRKIESLYPDRKYLELFARRDRPGWDVWGNEVEGIDIMSLSKQE